MGGAQQAAELPPRRPASAVVAIGTMTALAVVAVGVVVGWARLSARADAARAAAAEQESPDGGPPETLAGGMAPADVPADVAAAFDQPVIGAAVLDAPPPDVQGSCGEELTWDAEPSQRVVVTPDTMVIVLEGSGAFPGDLGPAPGEGERMQVVCTTTAEGDGWVSEGSSSGPMPAEGGSFLSVSSDGSGRARAVASVAVPEGSAWGVQPRSGYFVAYPVDGQETLPVTWTFRESRFSAGPPTSRVVFTDADGATVREVVAGQGG